jgi:hypothetical protein
MVEMTVGLPLWRSKHRGWLALESLIRQRVVPCEWELVVCEEPEECIGQEGLEKYRKDIENIRGKIKYVAISKWIPLSLKWITIVENSDPQSKYFLLQAGDCFSQPYRLADTYRIFEETGADWVHSSMGYFYLIADNQLYLYNRYIKGRDSPIGETALNMAIKMQHMRFLPIEEKNKTVDRWIYTNIKNCCSSIKVSENETDHWKLGFDSHGLNQISVRRNSRLKNEETLFKKVSNTTIKDIVDQSIIDRMKDEHQRLNSRSKVSR